MLTIESKLAYLMLSRTRRFVYFESHRKASMRDTSQNVLGLPRTERRMSAAKKPRESEACGVLVRGGAGGNRTHAWGFCRPLPYYLATAPMEKTL